MPLSFTSVGVAVVSGSVAGLVLTKLASYLFLRLRLSTEEWEQMQWLKDLAKRLGTVEHGAPVSEEELMRVVMYVSMQATNHDAALRVMDTLEQRTSSSAAKETIRTARRVIDERLVTAAAA